MSDSRGADKKPSKNVGFKLSNLPPASTHTELNPAVATTSASSTSTTSASATSISSPSGSVTFIPLKNTENLCADKNENYSYSNFKDIIVKKNTEYHVALYSNKFFSFTSPELFNGVLNDVNYPKNGLKIQISLDDAIAGNIEKGWNVIAPILVYYGVARAKIVNLGNSKLSDDKQIANEMGKQITIYASLHPLNTHWDNILKSITQALIDNEVKPGYRPSDHSSKHILNNAFISYRFDSYPETKEYIPAHKGKGAFPEGVENPLQHLSIPTPGLTPKPRSCPSSPEDSNKADPESRIKLTK